MNAFLALSIALLLSACVSGSLRVDPELEEYPLRSATSKESKGLKRCLRAGHAAMEAYKQKKHRIPRKARELPLDEPCSDYLMTIQPTQSGYELMAQFHENDQTVRWTVNEEGTIEEHLDDGEGMEDLDLM